MRLSHFVIFQTPGRDDYEWHYFTEATVTTSRCPCFWLKHVERRQIEPLERSFRAREALAKAQVTKGPVL